MGALLLLSFTQSYRSTRTLPATTMLTMMNPRVALMVVVMIGMAVMAAAQNVTVTTAPSNATVVVVTSASPSPSASPTTGAAVVVVVSVAPSPTAGVAKQLSVTVQNTSPASALGSPLPPWLKQLVLADFGLGTFFCS